MRFWIWICRPFKKVHKATRVSDDLEDWNDTLSVKLFLRMWFLGSSTFDCSFTEPPGGQSQL